MKLAFLKAKKCVAKYPNEVPVACVIVNQQGRVLSIEHNLVQTNNNPIHHAEMLAISNACKKIGSAKLNGCSVYTTLEPCLMCAGALMHARVSNIYFGAFDVKFGVLESNPIFYKNLNNEKQKLPYKPNIYGGLMEQECQNLLDTFFKNLRS